MWEHTSINMQLHTAVCTHTQSETSRHTHTHTHTQNKATEGQRYNLIVFSLMPFVQLSLWLSSDPLFPLISLTLSVSLFLSHSQTHTEYKYKYSVTINLFSTCLDCSALSCKYVHIKLTKCLHVKMRHMVLCFFRTVLRPH